MRQRNEAMTDYGPTPAVANVEPLYARHIHGGETVDYTPVGDVVYGDVIVISGMVGIALRPIPAGTAGSLAIEGCFEFPKATGDGGMAAGTLAYWDASAHVATGTSSGNTYMGKVETTTTTETAVRVQVESMANASGSVGWGTVPSATVAATGTGSGDGPVATGFTLVSAANGTKAVTLPTAAAGKVCIIKNNAAANLLVFPNTADKIDGGTATTGSLTMAQYTTAMFIAYDATDWYS
jgi:predicted RecA/RadA family phage recombinase